MQPSISQSEFELPRECDADPFSLQPRCGRSTTSRPVLLAGSGDLWRKAVGGVSLPSGVSVRLAGPAQHANLRFLLRHSGELRAQPIAATRVGASHVASGAAAIGSTARGYLSRHKRPFVAERGSPLERVDATRTAGSNISAGSTSVADAGPRKDPGITL